MENKIFDTIIVGQGPAGVSAALYLQRAGKSTVLVGKGPGGLAKADKIENYYGLAAPISGAELHQNGVAQATALGAAFATDEVLGLDFDGGAFTVQGKEGTYAGKTVLLATGAARPTLPLPGLKEKEGHGVSYCAVCDGFFFKGKPVAVLGSGDYALHEAAHLLQTSGSVTLLTNGQPAPEEGTWPAGLLVDTRPIAALAGESVLEQVSFKEGEPLPVNGLFVALGTASATDLAKKLGIETDGRYIAVGEDMATNFPGIYAAGDCTGGLLQVAKAVADGAAAATAIAKYLRAGE